MDDSSGRVPGCADAAAVPGTLDRALPEWDLAGIFGPDNPGALRDAMKDAIARSAAVTAEHEGKIANMSPGEIASLLQLSDEIENSAGDLGMPYFLRASQNANDEDATSILQNTGDQDSVVAGNLSFIESELAALGDDKLQEIEEHPDFSALREWMRHFRTLTRHTLSAAQERLLEDLDPAGAIVRLYAEETATMKYKMGRKRVGASDIELQLADPDPVVRKTAYQAKTAAYRDKKRPFLLMLNEIARVGNVSDTLRSYSSPEHASLNDSGLEFGELSAMLRAFDGSDAAHRWWTIRAKKHGSGKDCRLSMADRFAPMTDQRLIWPWEEAVSIVSSSWHRECPALAGIVDHIISSGRIDAVPRPDKETGAFCMPTLGSGAFVLLSYMETAEDVLTLAHEIGHAVHMVLAAECQRPMFQDPGLMLSETASTFSEQIAFEEMLRRTNGETELQRGIISSRIDDKINTTFAQVALHKFETWLYAARKEGEITSREIAREWKRAMSAYYGPGVDMDDDILWASKSHMFTSPFYFWNYAAADCLAFAISAQRQDDRFQEKFENLLRSGGAASHRVLLAPFDIDTADPAVWSRGISSIENLVDSYERL